MKVPLCTCENVATNYRLGPAFRICKDCNHPLVIARRGAARVMLDAYFEAFGDGNDGPILKTDDDLVIEAWLFEQMGEYDLANKIREFIS